MTYDELKNALPDGISHIYNGIPTQAEILAVTQPIWWGNNGEGAFFAGTTKAVSAWKAYTAKDTKP